MINGWHLPPLPLQNMNYQNQNPPPYNQPYQSRNSGEFGSPYHSGPVVVPYNNYNSSPFNNSSPPHQSSPPSAVSYGSIPQNNQYSQFNDPMQNQPMQTNYQMQPNYPNPNSPFNQQPAQQAQFNPNPNAPVLITNPLMKPSSQDPSSSVTFEKFHYMQMPFCFISKGSDVTTVTPKELFIKQNIAYCKSSVKAGAGYNIWRLPLDKITKWEVITSKLLCFGGKHHVRAIVLPTKSTAYAQLPNPDDDQTFSAAMNTHAVSSRTELAPPGTPIIGTFKQNIRCGLSSKTLTLHPNGLAVMEDLEQGLVTNKTVTTAFLQDFSYIRYTTTSLFASICGDGVNRIELTFAGDHYYMDLSIPGEKLGEVHTAIMHAVLRRPPQPPIRVIQGKIGELAIGPEFTTISMQKGSVMLGQKEVITVKTADISHLYASLPSWQTALVTAIRDIEMYRIYRLCARLWTTDLALLFGWPCSFFSNLYISMLLFLKAMISVFKFLMIFFFRKTALIFGGPGPAKQVSFEPNEDPEAFLRDIGDTIKEAQARSVFRCVSDRIDTKIGSSKDVSPTIIQGEMMSSPTPAKAKSVRFMQPEAPAVASSSESIASIEKLDALEKHILRVEGIAMKLLTAAATSPPPAPPHVSHPVAPPFRAVPEPPKKLAPLPEGWEELKTPEGEIYYGSLYSDETTWDRPTAPAKKPAPLPEGWEELKTPEGEIYYGSLYSDETTWDLPTKPAARPPNRR
jgi:hypothetical protein